MSVTFVAHLEVKRLYKSTLITREETKFWGYSSSQRRKHGSICVKKHSLITSRGSGYFKRQEQKVSQICYILRLQMNFNSILPVPENLTELPAVDRILQNNDETFSKVNVVLYLE